MEKKISKVQESSNILDFCLRLHNLKMTNKFHLLKVDHYESKNLNDQKTKPIDSDETKFLEIKKYKVLEEKRPTSLDALHAVSKKKWLNLKKEFLNKQKLEIAELKNKLDTLNASLNAKLNEKYKAQNSNLKTDDIFKGCVLKLTLNPSNPEFAQVFKLSRQEFKNKYLNEVADHVAYVDVERNNCKVLIRCKTRESAKEMMKSPVLSQFGKLILEGGEELEYFEKIFFNRTKKLNKKFKKTDVALIKEAQVNFKYLVFI